MKRVYFEMIADNRYVDNIETEIIKLKNETIKALVNLGCTFETYDNFGLDFGNNVIQNRVEFCIDKNTRKITYNAIYKAVNSVKPVPYTVE